MADFYRPMIVVDGHTVKCPSVFEWAIHDVSHPDAGRDQAATMWKGRVARKRKISLAWNGLSWAETSEILQRFSPEYVWVYYPDMLSRQYETREFYVSEESKASVHIWTVGNRTIRQVAFDIIER